MNLVLLAIQQLLKASVANVNSPLNNIKQVFYGDPILIPDKSFPSITISPLSTEVTLRWSQYDQRKTQVEMRLVYNVKSFFSENPINDQVKQVQSVVEKIEWGATRWLGIIDVIQENSTLPYNWTPTCQLAKVTTVNYVFSTDRGFPTYEVVINVEVNIIINR